MAQRTQKGIGVRLRRILGAKVDPKASRAERRSISGVAFLAQKFRLVLDEADGEGNESYPCRIYDASDQGFGVSCRAMDELPGLFHVGAQMTLEASDRKRLRVEIRWIRDGRLGMTRVVPNWE